MKPAALICALVALFSCNTKPDDPDEIPAVKQISDYKQTEFVTTLENSISANKNSLYSSILLLAWDEAERQMKSPAVAGPTHPQSFKWLVNSNSHSGSIPASEYTLDVDLDDGIMIGARCDKRMPFAIRYNVLPKGMKFGNVQVAAFGANSGDEDLLENFRILSYKDDDNFVVELIPKDSSESILMMKGWGPFKTLGEAYKILQEAIQVGEKAKHWPGHAWRYALDAEDEFVSPMIRFNIESNFPEFQGIPFRCENNDPHSFEGAYMRIGFLLNERGAVAEMEAVVAVDSMGRPEIVVKKHPKKWILDKPFLIVLKKSQQKNPYLVMRIQNAELLIPENGHM